MSEELKPCPFCGNQDVKWQVEAEIKDNLTRYMAAIFCDECGCRGPFLINLEEKPALINAVKEWNKRS